MPLYVGGLNSHKWLCVFYAEPSIYSIILGKTHRTGIGEGFLKMMFTQQSHAITWRF